MAISLENKTALITGTAQGIGACINQGFLKEGAYTIACDINTDGLSKLYDDHPKCTVKQLDVSDPAAWKDLVDAIPHIDYLVNVAGVIRPNYIADAHLSEIDQTIDINLKGTMYGCYTVIQKMRSAGGGHIINLASLAGIAPVQGLSVYVASKFGVRGFSLALAQELKSENIDVTVVAPDATDTHMLDDQMESKAAALTFSGKILTVEDVWQAIYKEGIKGKKSEIWIPFNRGLQAYIGATFPGLAGWLTKTLTKKGLKEQEKFRKKRQ